MTTRRDGQQGDGEREALPLLGCWGAAGRGKGEPANGSKARACGKKARGTLRDSTRRQVCSHCLHAQVKPCKGSVQQLQNKSQAIRPIRLDCTTFLSLLAQVTSRSLRKAEPFPPSLLADATSRTIACPCEMRS